MTTKLSSRTFILRFGNVLQPYMFEEIQRLQDALLAKSVIVDFGEQLPTRADHVSIHIETKDHEGYYGMVATVSGDPDTLQKIDGVLDRFDRIKFLERVGEDRVLR